jgi:hypothetical protein
MLALTNKIAIIADAFDPLELNNLGISLCIYAMEKNCRRKNLEILLFKNYEHNCMRFSVA